MMNFVVFCVFLTCCFLRFSNLQFFACCFRSKTCRKQRVLRVIFYMFQNVPTCSNKKRDFGTAKNTVNSVTYEKCSKISKTNSIWRLESSNIGQIFIGIGNHLEHLEHLFGNVEPVRARGVPTGFGTLGTFGTMLQKYHTNL